MRDAPDPEDLSRCWRAARTSRSPPWSGRRTTSGEVPVAFVVLNRPEAMSAQDDKALFDGQLAAYKHPRDVVFTDALRRGAIGTVQVDELRRRLCSA